MALHDVPEAGIAQGVLGLIADMLKTIKTKQDEILYRMKKRDFGDINGGD